MRSENQQPGAGVSHAPASRRWLWLLMLAVVAGLLARTARAQTGVSVSGPSTLPQTESATYTATLPPTSCCISAWSASPSGGLIFSNQNQAAIQITGGTTPGTYTLTVTTTDHLSGSIVITVLPPPVTLINPTTAAVGAGQSITFSAGVVNSNDPHYSWSTDDAGGQVEGNGAYPWNGAGSLGTYYHTQGIPGGVFHVYALSFGDGFNGVRAVATVQVVNVAVTPATIIMAPGNTRQFYADLTGSQQAVQWSSTMPGATFSASGLMQIPATAAAGSYTITAQTVGNPTATGTATMTVVATVPVSGVAVAPSRSVLDSGQQEPFAAVVEGSNGEPHPNQTVNWAVTGPAAAAVTAYGLFTAPATPGVYTVTATAQADATKSGIANITVGEDLMVLPSSATLMPGATQTFTAQVSGVANPAVTWSVEEGPAGGGISPAGLYSAPATPGIYHVVAVATDAGGSVQGIATVMVSTSPRVAIAVSPPETAIATGGMQQFTAAVSGAADAGVIWSSSSGSIDATGLFTAPAYYGTVTVTAASRAEPHVQAQATVVVTAVDQGQSFQYDANGNVLADGSRTYEWDAESRLTAINVGAHRSEFGYDGLGRRVLITEKDNGVITTSRHYIWSGDELLEETDATTAPTSGSLGAGGFGAIDCNQLAGWAWNPANPNTPITVDVYDGSTKIATTLAAAFRGDVRALGGGNGNHGYFIPTPAALKTNTQHSVTVKVGGTQTSLGTRTVTCAAPSFGGYLDAANCTQIAGWAWDGSQPNSPINIDIYDGSTLMTSVLANTFRQDLANAGAGNGNHGLFLSTPPSLKNGLAHSISFKIGGTSTTVGPVLSLTCPAAAFAGNLDGADCTQINGWAWDAKQPNAAVNVDIYDGTVLLASLPAATFRQDLQTAGFGNGNHGFSYSTPALYTGSAHSITVNFGGTALALPASPKPIICPNETIQTRFFPGGMQSSGAAYYFSYDHLGSIREVTNSSGAVVSRYDYDAYGRLTINQGTPPRFGFAGSYYHSPSGLSLTKYRAYDPDLGRWESRDPVTGNGNPYDYAANDPIDLYDPEGATPKPPPGPPSPFPPGWGPTLPNGSPEIGPNGLPPGLDDSPPFSPDYPTRWAPDSRNKRGGNWYQPGNPAAPKKSWEGNAPIPHWDKDDGTGNRTRCTKDGKPVTADEAHGKKTQPPQPKPSKMQQLLEDAKRLLNPLPFLQWLADHPPAAPPGAPVPPVWLILAGG